MLHQVLGFATGHLPWFVLFAAGLRARPSDLRAMRDTPRPFARALAVSFLAVPLLALAVVALLRLPMRAPAAASVILLMVACPGAPVLAMRHTKTTDDRPIGLQLFLALTAGSIVMIPVWLAIVHALFGIPLAIGIGALIVRVVTTLVAPLAVGLLVAYAAPRVAKPLARVSFAIFAVLVLAVVVLLIARGALLLRETPGIAIVAVLALVTTSALLGQWAADDDTAARPAFEQAAVAGNPAVALAIASLSFPGAKPLAYVATYILVQQLCLVPLHLWTRSRARGTKARPPP